MLLDPEKTKEKAWKGLYEYVEIIKPLLLEYNLDEVNIILFGSVHRGEARCPRDIHKFHQSLLFSISDFKDDIRIEYGISDEFLYNIIGNAYENCINPNDLYKSTDCYINYVKEKLPDCDLLIDLMETERCSDLDAYIILDDFICEDLFRNKEYYELSDFAYEKIKNIIYPLYPSIGLLKESDFEKWKKSISGGYESKTIKLSENNIRPLFSLFKI